MRKNTTSKSGFSLIELLVVIAIIGTLIGLLLPAVQKVRSLMARLQCAANMKELALALHNYHDSYSRFPTGSLRKGPSMPQQTGWGWGAKILPFIEQDGLYRSIDFNKGTMVGKNASLIAHPINHFRCPADDQPSTIQVGSLNIAAGNYCGNAGTRGMGTPGIFFEFSNARLLDIRDGTSYTFLLGERVTQIQTDTGSYTSGWCGYLAHQNGYKGSSVPHLEVLTDIPINLSRDFPACFSSYHGAGANFVMCDGSVHFFSQKINPATFHALGTRSGREPVSDY